MLDASVRVDVGLAVLTAVFGYITWVYLDGRGSYKELWLEAERIKEATAKVEEAKQLDLRVRDIERQYINRTTLEEIVEKAVANGLAVGLADIKATLKTLPCQNGTVCRMSHKEE
jgi:hypothetical protein